MVICLLIIRQANQIRNLSFGGTLYSSRGSRDATPDVDNGDSSRVRYAKIPSATRPATSVSRKSRPA